MSNLLSNAEQTLKDLATACGDSTHPDWLAQAHLLAVHRLVNVFAYNFVGLAPIGLPAASMEAATWVWNQAALGSFKRYCDMEIGAQSSNFLPEAQDARGLLPLDAVRGLVDITGTLPPNLRALALANLTSAVENGVAAHLVIRVQKFILGCAVMARDLYRAWLMILENEAASRLGLVLPHPSDLQAPPYRVDAPLRAFATYRETLLADLVAYLTPESAVITSQPLASTGPITPTEPTAPSQSTVTSEPIRASQPMATGSILPVDGVDASLRPQPPSPSNR